MMIQIDIYTQNNNSFPPQKNLKQKNNKNKTKTEPKKKEEKKTRTKNSINCGCRCINKLHTILIF